MSEQPLQDEIERLRKDLAAAQRLAQSTLDALHDHIAVVDASGVIIGVNRAWERFAVENGSSSEAVGIGVNYFGVCERSTGDDRLQALAAAEGIRCVLRGEKSEYGMTYPCHSPNEARWFRMRVTPVGDADVAKAVLAHQDITEPTLVQQAIQRAKDTSDEASAAKDRFIANLSHELRTPLTPVLAAVEMMERDPSFSSAQHESAQMVARNVQVEVRLIDDLLDLTRISRGKLVLNLSHVDLHALLWHVLDICRAEAQAKQLTVEVELDALHHHVHGDSQRLQQAVWNLLKNAVKFTPYGGRITVRTTQPSDNRIALAVSDTGIGIDPALLPRIFEPFEQGGGGTTRQFGGLGLGLAISKGVADIHGGSLTAQSEGPGRGATFTLELTTSLAAEPSSSHRPVEAGQHRGARVLLVEDHHDTRVLLARALRGFGYDVSTADSVASALERVTSSEFDLLLSDIGLPDGSGLDLMRALSAIRKPVRAIALSGFGMAEDIRRSKECGFQEHLTKPVSLTALEEAAERLLTGNG